jgi:hypothetical protein
MSGASKPQKRQMCAPLFGLAETAGQFAAIAAEGFGFAARAGITEQPSSKRTPTYRTPALAALDLDRSSGLVLCL